MTVLSKKREKMLGTVPKVLPKDLSILISSLLNARNVQWNSSGTFSKYCDLLLQKHLCYKTIKLLGYKAMRQRLNFLSTSGFAGSSLWPNKCVKRITCYQEELFITHSYGSIILAHLSGAS